MCSWNRCCYKWCWQRMHIFINSFINILLCLEKNLFLKFLDILLEVLCLSLEFLVLFLNISLCLFFFDWNILVIGESNRKRFEGWGVCQLIIFITVTFVGVPKIDLVYVHFFVVSFDYIRIWWAVRTVLHGIWRGSLFVLGDSGIVFPPDFLCA